MKHIGLHIRLTSTFTDLIEKAVRLNMPIFQCFFVSQETGELVIPNASDLERFLNLRRRYFKDVYVHGSYWINLANAFQKSHHSLHRELELAKKLEFTHMVLHPGAAKGVRTKREGIEVMARLLNAVTKTEHDIKFVLENAAHSKMTIGGDLEDFKTLLPMLDYPEKIVFCIDTAHAHAYGYDLIDEQSRNNFIALLDATIGIDKIAVLHLNDTKEKRGTKMDRHAAIGTGILGDQVLKSFMFHPKLAKIPVIMEMPSMLEEEEVRVFEKVRRWL